LSAARLHHLVRDLCCRSKAAALADQLHGIYLRDKRVSETVKAGILETLGLLVEAAPQVFVHRLYSGYKLLAY
jgi:hypothetical protein